MTGWTNTGISDYERVIGNIHNHLLGYIRNEGIKALILGVSGGIDSTVCAALAKPVCDVARIPLVGRSITIESNKKDEIDRSVKVGNAFCHEFDHWDLTEDYTNYLVKKGVRNPSILGDDDKAKIRRGNMKARFRMIELYDLAQEYGGMVLSTDNFTELMARFWTLHGDVGDYGMIQNLWKSEVYALATHIMENHHDYKSAEAQAIAQSIIGIPTDGLGISESDLDQLGVGNYAEADTIFQEFFGGNFNHENHPIIIRHKKTTFKVNNPVNITREELLK